MEATEKILFSLNCCFLPALKGIGKVGWKEQIIDMAHHFYVDFKHLLLLNKFKIIANKTHGKISEGHSFPCGFLLL